MAEAVSQSESALAEIATVNHVPGELCIVVNDPGFRRSRVASAEALARYGEAMYHNAIRQLNEGIRTLRQPLAVGAPTGGLRASAIDPMGRSPLERDLTPTAGFRQYFGLDANAPVFRPLAAARSVTRPWFVLARARRRATLLVFCAVGPSELHEYGQSNAQSPRTIAYRALPEHQQRVRELVKLLNWRLLPLTDVSAKRGATIRAATPNWLTCPTHSHGSPGTLPVRISPVEVNQLGASTPGKFTFSFIDNTLTKRGSSAKASLAERQRLLTQQQLNTLVERMRLPPAAHGSSPVVVAILDTAPPVKQIIEQSKKSADNALLQDVAAQLAIPGSNVSIAAQGSTGNSAHIAGFQANLRDQLSATTPVSLSDHGLFVAGIVRDIAPQATIRLLKVLDDSGVGDIAALFDILHTLPLELERGTRLIVNLSLVADLPTADELLAHWFPNTNSDVDALRRSWKMIASMLSQTHLCLQEVLDWLADQNVLVVAAAGNEAFDPTIRPEPLFPAAYDSVLAVAAVTRGDKPAQFSNRGDMRVFGNGVSVFGGQGIATSDNALPVVPLPGRDGWRDAVAGIFSADTIPLASRSEARNETGWVWWSGTSFATPVVTAIAANLLLDPPTSRLSAIELIQTIRNMATISEADLETAGPFDCSAIFARQVWKDSPVGPN